MKPINTIKSIFTTLIVLGIIQSTIAQDNGKSQTFPSLKFFASGQIWLRHTQLNPGSTIDNINETNVTDISIRRFRMGMYGDLSDRWFVKLQFGVNNTNYVTNNSNLKILDLLAIYKVNNWLNIGFGKNGYTGPSRYASVGSSSMLGVDIPIFALSTVGITDDLIRKFSVFIKGDLGKLNYRIVLAKPKKVAIPLPTDKTDFKIGNPNIQPSAYFKYQFKEAETTKSAFTPGTYFGTKKIITLGAGFLYQKDAMWNISDVDTTQYSMFQFATDLLIDYPLNSDNTRSITIYAAYFNTNFGDNYLRSIGVNNPANGSSRSMLTGTGNAYPCIGTGQVYYLQLGYRFAFDQDKYLIKALVPYFNVQYADYQKLDQTMILYESGINLLMNGHRSKLTLGVQNRPIYMTNGDDQIVIDERKYMFVLQYQFKLSKKVM